MSGGGLHNCLAAAENNSEDPLSVWPRNGLPFIDDIIFPLATVPLVLSRR